MAKTQLADIIVPAQFAGYVLQRTAEKSDLFQSGIVIRNPDYDERASLGGNQVNMPHWNDLTGNRQPLSDSAPLVPAKLVADQDIARIHNDGNAWSWNHLATWLLVMIRRWRWRTSWRTTGIARINTCSSTPYRCVRCGEHGGQPVGNSVRKCRRANCGDAAQWRNLRGLRPNASVIGATGLSRWPCTRRLKPRCASST